jgi:hypothetical protein
VVEARIDAKSVDARLLPRAHRPARRPPGARRCTPPLPALAAAALLAHIVVAE